MKKRRSKKVDRSLTQIEDDFVRTDLEQMSRATNYLDYQYMMIKSYLGKRILEVGAGIGNITSRIHPDATLVVSIEPNEACFNELEAEFRGQKSLILMNKIFDDCDPKELQSYNFDTILCINVLEHVENDLPMIGKMIDILPEKGKLILVVPSPTWAFGVIDQAVGHFRRYSKGELMKAVESMGLSVHSCRYFNPIGLVGWWLNGRFFKRVAQSDFQILVFDKIVVPVQRVVEGVIEFPIGQSLLVVLEKGADCDKQRVR